MILTGNTARLKTPWIYVLLYLPAILTACAFSLPTGLNPVLHSFTNTSLGWIAEPHRNGWDWFYDGYCAVFAIIGLVLIWQWGRHSSDKQVKKQAQILLFSLSAAYLLATVVGLVLPWFSVGIPQLSPLILCIPVAAICYIAKRYNFLRTAPTDQREIILNDSIRTNIYKCLTITFIISSIVNLMAQYVFYRESSLAQVLLFSAFLLLIAIAIIIISKLRSSDQLKDTLLSLAIAVAIPIITLRYSQYGGLTIWAFALALMVICLLFNRSTILVAVYVSAVVTQVIIWMIAPTVAVEVNKADYMVRIGILSVAFVLALYVNRVFVLKLKDNALQIRFQRVLSETSYDFLTINQSNLEEKISHMLRNIGGFFHVDRAYVCLFSPKLDSMDCPYVWCAQDAASLTRANLELPINAIPWWKGSIEDVSKLPAKEQELKDRLTEQGIKSLMTVPIEGSGIVHGFIGMEAITSTKKWNDAHLKMLRIFTNLLADAFARVQTEQDIEYLAYYDHLTGLPNRTLFTDRLNQAINLSKRNSKFLGVMFLDLDSFKVVNDTMGHNGGDILLKEVANTLSQHLRKTDTVARFGGDEFMILLNNVTEGTDMAKVADSVMRLFEKPFMINEQEFFITASGGVAIYPVDGEDADSLVKNADIAMYKAKSRGKNQHVLCTTDMKAEVQKNMLLSNSLYHANERNELIIYYQPQVSLETKQVIGFEALLRWQHPQLGMISPGIFIPLAEKNGLINSIGEWVLETACRQNVRWQELGLPHLRMAVNLSVSQFKNPKLVDIVEHILQETGLDPRYLELEITESVAVKESDYIIDVLTRLKDLGVSISIDDFGTEYSSLSRLKSLPVDRIKIDMQFVQGIEGSAKDQAITKVIINLAKSLGLKVIAEGVETAPQLEFLNQKMCDEVQGFYYYKPMPASEVEVILRQTHL